MSSSKRIFRIVTIEDCALADGGSADEFGGRSLQPDGFVHLSFTKQIQGTLDRHYSGATELALFEVDRKRLGSAVRIEPSRDGADFPHPCRALGSEDLIRRWAW